MTKKSRLFKACKDFSFIQLSNYREEVTKATISLLFGKYPQYNSFNEYIDKAEVLIYKGNGYESKVFPLFHTGYYGVKLNRKGGYNQHVIDWSRIKG